jgi:hypothetical protein
LIHDAVQDMADKSVSEMADSPELRKLAQSVTAVPEK